MEQAAPAETLCEVCAKATARKSDLLCSDCSRAFTLMLDLLRRHPEVDATDLDRMREVFQWRTEKTKAAKATQVEPGLHKEETVLPAAPSVLAREQIRGRAICEVCAKPLVETDYLLCSDCSRAYTIVLDLLRESAPLLQTWLNGHPEVTAEDLNRIRGVFVWRSSRLGLGKPKAKVDITATS